MEAYFIELRALHVSAAIASFTLFGLRAIALDRGAGWPLRRGVRRLSYAVDTILLAAAVTLTTIICQYPIRNDWLTAKLLLLGIYILLGYQALRAPARRTRLLCLAAAAATFLFIVSVARSHEPLGIFAAV